MGVFSGIAFSTVGLIVALGGAVALSSGTGTACVGGTVDASSVTKLTVDGYTGDQLTNAADIMNAATSVGLGSQAQLIGVMTAMGESGLKDLTTGDGAINPDGSASDSIGLFQQQSSWGTVATRLDPTKSATLFFARLATVSGWQNLTPTAAAHAVQGNADPSFYTPYYSPAAAVVQALLANESGSDCSVSSDAQALAQELVHDADTGLLVGSVPDHIKEIRWIAQGKVVPNCGVDVRILQILVLAIHTFGRIGVSDINTRCTGQLLGGGTESSHYINGGGHAVDIYSLAGHNLTGADGLSIRLIDLLDPIVPPAARIGQEECRAAKGITLGLTHFTQFDDFCTHLHIDVAYTNQPLNLPASAN
jgi:hypothetical protein